MLAIVILALASHSAIDLWLYLIALSSDYLDGYLARSLHSESLVGRRLDPLADALLAISALVYLVWGGWLPRAGAAAIVVAMATAYAAYSSGYWTLLPIRILAATSVISAYATYLIGFSTLAYGWHVWYLAALALVAAPLAWFYRCRLVSEIIR